MIQHLVACPINQIFMPKILLLFCGFGDDERTLNHLYNKLITKFL